MRRVKAICGLSRLQFEMACFLQTGDDAQACSRGSEHRRNKVAKWNLHAQCM